MDQVARMSSERGLSASVPEYYLSTTASVKGCLLFSATWPGCQPLPQLIRPWSCRSTSLSTYFPVPTGSAVPVVRTGGGYTNCVRITTLQPTYGVPPSGEAIPERRFGPRWLRVNDDDQIVQWFLTAKWYLNDVWWCHHHHQISLLKAVRRSRAHV